MSAVPGPSEGSSMPDTSTTTKQNSPKFVSRRLNSERRHTTTACTGCRRKHLKCDGGPPPCERCVKFNLRCRYPTAADGRTTAVKGKRLNDLENDRRLLNTLLTNLQNISIARMTQGPADSQTQSSNLVYERDVEDLVGLEPCQTTVAGSLAGDGPHKPQRPDLAVSGMLSRETASSRPRKRRALSADNVTARVIAPGAVRSFGNFAMSDAIRANHHPVEIQARQLQLIFARIETLLPLHVHVKAGAISGAIVDVVLSFQNAARALIAQGSPARTVLSMDDFDLDLFDRDRTSADEHTVASWACEWGKSWTGFPVEARLAAIYYAGSLMRWLVLPCKETYEMMCPLVRPLPCQLIMPHTMDIDFWAPSVMRQLQLRSGRGLFDHLTTNIQRLNWAEGLERCTETFTVPCNFADTGALMDGHGGHYRTTKRFAPDFITFLDKEDSWSVHRDLLSVMPELRGRVLIHDE